MKRLGCAVISCAAFAGCVYIDHLATPPSASRYVLAFTLAALCVLCAGLLVKPEEPTR